MVRSIGLDIGNDSIKLVMEGGRLAIPNIVAPGSPRNLLREEDNVLEALDVEVFSRSLTGGWKQFFVGELAVEDEDNLEMSELENKVESEQSLIVTLVALAVTALSKSESFTENPVVEEFVIGSGLPIRQYAKYKDALIQRLEGEHEVKFVSTPKYRGRTVRIIIKKVTVGIEGAAAILNIATNDDLSVKDETAYHGTVGVCEIGALTTDFPIMKKLQPDNRFSHGEYFGIASYLDAIRQDVYDKFGYNFQSRAKLIKRIRESSYLINLVGERRADIKPVVDEHFRRAAVRVVELIQKRWAKYPDAQAFYVLGGGAGALRPYIEERTHGKLPLRFVNDSEWMNAAGYLKMLNNRGMNSEDVTKQPNNTSW